MKRLEKYVIVAKEDEYSQSLKQKLTTLLEINGYLLDEDHPQVLITIGGDGTFLHAIHRYLSIEQNLVIVGIHTGTLGFFTSYKDNELDVFLEDLHSEHFDVYHLPILGVNLNQNNQNYHFEAINEIRIENVVRTQSIEVKINHKTFETFRGTGLCISTQAGSTAYNRSLSGAILQDGLNLLQLTEITGIHHRAYRSLGSPLILKENTVLELSSENFDQAILCYDHLSLPINNACTLKIAYTQKSIQVWMRKDNNYLERLQSLF
jgi:NAD+ kinase